MGIKDFLKNVYKYIKPYNYLEDSDSLISLAGCVLSLVCFTIAITSITLWSIPIEMLRLEGLIITLLIIININHNKLKDK